MAMLNIHRIVETTVNVVIEGLSIKETIDICF